MRNLYPFASPQNPLLNTQRFIERCKKCGLHVTDEGLRACREADLLSPVMIDEDGAYYSTFQVYCIDRVYHYIPLLEQHLIAGTPAEEALEHLKTTSLDFSAFLQFLLKVEDVYLPYFKSGSGNIQVSGNMQTWQKQRAVLDVGKEMSACGISTDSLAAWYKELTELASEILNGKDDWLQLWKNIEWNKKERLEGTIRRGVEYLQWAVMIKQVLEDHLGREILDVDELEGVSPKGVITLDTTSKENPHRYVRDGRNRRYSDSNKNYYSDRYKRLEYLANDFGINYQPKVMVFVEGYTEEKILPTMFRETVGIQHEHMGIEFVTLGGITNFFGNVVGKGSDKKIISNFKSVISYNLNKWQTIPFFVGDEENGVLQSLITGTCIHFDGKDRSLPKGWYELWGQNAEPTDPDGKDFELANYTSLELVTAIKSLDSSIVVTEAQIEGLRHDGKGLKLLPAPYGEKIHALKANLAEKLYENLKKDYLQTKDIALLKRPVFRLLHRIAHTAALNHAPCYRIQELDNRQVILDILEGRRTAW